MLYPLSYGGGRGSLPPTVDCQRNGAMTFANASSCDDCTMMWDTP